MIIVILTAEFNLFCAINKMKAPGKIRFLFWSWLLQITTQISKEKSGKLQLTNNQQILIIKHASKR